MRFPKGAIGIVIIVVILAVVILAVWMIATYNSFVSQEEGIDSQWAQVTNEYQRKIDLIPELVSTVEDYQEFERSTLENVTALRTRWMDAKSTEDQVNISTELDRALLDIIVTYEEYPYLQSIEAVSSLPDTALEGQHLEQAAGNFFGLCGTRQRLIFAASDLSGGTFLLLQNDKRQHAAARIAFEKFLKKFGRACYNYINSPFSNHLYRIRNVACRHGLAALLLEIVCKSALKCGVVVNNQNGKHG